MLHPPIVGRRLQRSLWSRRAGRLRDLVDDRLGLGPSDLPIAIRAPQDAVAPSYTIHVRATPRTVVVSIAGEFDMHAAAEFERRLDIVARATATPVVLHLAAVTFIDSVGLTALMRANANIRRRGRRLIVRSTSRSVRRLLDITGCDRSLELAQHHDQWERVPRAIHPADPAHDLYVRAQRARDSVLTSANGA
jgi:anti-anti-sigma factor